jgi:hypothetical protein
MIASVLRNALVCYRLRSALDTAGFEEHVKAQEWLLMALFSINFTGQSTLRGWPRLRDFRKADDPVSRLYIVLE